jgi:hypothetical protein
MGLTREYDVNSVMKSIWNVHLRFHAFLKPLTPALFILQHASTLEHLKLAPHRMPHLKPCARKIVFYLFRNCCKPYLVMLFGVLLTIVHVISLQQYLNIWYAEQTTEDLCSRLLDDAKYAARIDHADDDTLTDEARLFGTQDFQYDIFSSTMPPNAQHSFELDIPMLPSPNDPTELLAETFTFMPNVALPEAEETYADSVSQSINLT